MASLSTPLWEDCYWRLPLLECRGKHTHTHTSCLQPQDSWLHTFDQMSKHSFVKIPEFSVSVVSKIKSKTRKISAGNLRFLLFWNSLCWNAPHKKRSLISSSRRRRRKIPLSHKSKTSNSFGGSPLVPTCTDLQFGLRWDCLKAPKTLQQCAIACSASTALD